MNTPTTYNGILIDSGNNNLRFPGVFSISGTAVLFKTEEKQYQLPFHLLNITHGGNNKELVFFMHPQFPHLSFYTSDKNILKEAAFHEVLELKQQIKSVRKTRRNLLLGTGIFFGFLLAMIVSLFFMKNYFVESLAHKVPQEWEKEVGDKMFETLKLQYTFIENDSLKKHFLAAAKPLTDVVEKQGTHVQFYFIKDAGINAFALPGGKVVIQTGLIDHAKSWEEVLGVVGHELAHVTRRHHLRGVINEMGLWVIVSAVVGDVNSLYGAIIGTGGDLASLSNSRDFETEADETGMDFLIQAHINPKGMISFFKTLQKESENKMDDYTSFMSTHPATSDRIKHLEALLKEKQYDSKEIKLNFNLFKNQINQLK